MSCEKPQTQLYLYLDGELAPPEAFEVEHHLRACAVCQQEVEAHHRLQALLRAELTQEDMPAQLWQTIRRRLTQEADMDKRPVRRWTRRQLVAGIGALAALCLVAFGVHTWVTPAVPQVVQEIVDSQVRSHLMAMPYYKISADPSAIRHWFDDKIAFRVLVPHMSPQRYAFLGVRLNYFLNRRVAEMAYKAQTHTMSFVMFSNKDIALTAMQARRDGARTYYVKRYKGYSTVLWQDGDFFCGLVSDMAPGDLLTIAREALTAGMMAS